MKIIIILSEFEYVWILKWDSLTCIIDRTGWLSVSTQRPVQAITIDCRQGSWALRWGTGASWDPGLRGPQHWTQLLARGRSSTPRSSTPPERAACFRLRPDTSCAPGQREKKNINQLYFFSLTPSHTKQNLKVCFSHLNQNQSHCNSY